MNILITGENGFIAKNLSLRLKEFNYSISGVNKLTSNSDLNNKLEKADFIFHLAGENRSEDSSDFEKNNHLFTKNVCNFLSKKNIKTPIIFSSSTQASQKNPYGISKRLAEKQLIELQNNNNNHVLIYRLNGVYGKWAKPNYNSVVATFCHRVANNLELEIHDRREPLLLTFIDDVVDSFIENMESILAKDKKSPSGIIYCDFSYEISISDLARKIMDFSKNGH